MHLSSDVYKPSVSAVDIQVARSRTNVVQLAEDMPIKAPADAVEQYRKEQELAARIDRLRAARRAA